MNLRGILHLFKGEWHRLRWVLLLLWVVMIAAAWPDLTFRVPVLEAAVSRESNLPDLRGISGNPYSNPAILWEDMRHLLGLLAFTTAALIGMPAGSWNGTRPLRRAEVMASKSLALIVFAGMPLAGLSVLNGAWRGFSTWELLLCGVAASLKVIQRLIVSCLFGCVCGAFWRWLAACVLVVAAGSLASVVSGAPPDFTWFYASPFTGSGWVGILPWAWFIVEILPPLAGVVLIRRLQPNTRIAVTGGLWLALMTFCPFGLLSSRYIEWRAGWDQMVKRYSALGPEIRPVLASSTLKARFHDPASDPSRQSVPGAGNGPVLVLEPEWQPPPAPSGCFMAWERMGNSTLSVDGRVVATGVPKKHFYLIPGWTPDTDAAGAILAQFPEGTSFGEVDPYKREGQRGRGHTWSQNVTFDYLAVPDSSPLVDGAQVRYAAELTGTLYRYEVVADIPPGETVHLEVDGRKFDARCSTPSDGSTGRQTITADLIEPAHPVAMLCESSSTFSTWKAFVYLPVSRQILSCEARRASHPLLAGCSVDFAHYVVMALGSMPAPDLTGMRLILMRPRFLGVTRGMTESGPMTLEMKADLKPIPDLFRIQGRGENQQKIPDWNRRPAPRTATPEAYWRWTTHSYGYSIGWTKRDAMEFLPRQLPLLLRAKESGPDTGTWTAAVVSACPEPLKQQVLTALSSQDTGTWIPAVTQARGWTREAEPYLRQRIRAGLDPDGNALVALASLEDPATIPDLLAGIENILDLEIYEAVRQVPGIETGLDEAVRKACESTRRKFPWPAEYGRWRTTLAAARHGQADAFEEMFGLWSETAARSPGSVENLGLLKIVIVPSEPASEPSDVLRALKGHTAKDYHFDPFSRCWTLNSASPAKP